MRRLLALVYFIAATATAAALPAQAKELRVPKDGKPALLVDLPTGWHTKTDRNGGMLLIPPATSQHAMLYLGVLVDDSMRGAALGTVAAAVGKTVGIERFDKEEPARVSDAKGGLHRGTAFYGKVPEKRGFSRKAKIVIIPLAPGTWAQAWTVTQPGMNSVEYDRLDAVLNSITVAGE